MQEHFLVGASKTLQDIHQDLGLCLQRVHYSSFYFLGSERNNFATVTN